MEAAGGLTHGVDWRAFSLEQQNLEADADPDELWAQPERRRGLLPGAAGKWAQAKGPDVFAVVQEAFFHANHVDRKKIGKPEVVVEVLDAAGLDGDRILHELLEDPAWLDGMRKDHDEARELGVFGVPTFVFGDAQPLFVRFTEITDGERAVELFRRVETVALDPVMHELKKPSGYRP